MASGSRRGRNVIVCLRMHAKELMFMAVLLQLLGSGRASYRLPADAHNGLYMGFVDESGEKQLKYLGKGGNATHPNQDDPACSRGIDISGPGRKLLQTAPGTPDLLTCDHLGSLNPSDVVTATNCLAAYFGEGNDFYGSVVFLANGVFAYGCNHSENGGQYATSNSIWVDAATINNVCGSSASGYATHSNLQAGYGRRPSTLDSFC